MKIKNIDHFVITTQDLQACLDFYVETLGMNTEKVKAIITSTFPVVRFPFMLRRANSSQLPFIRLSVRRTFA